MKNFFTYFLLISVNFCGLSQTKAYQYDYDVAGNRIARNVIYIRAAALINPTVNQVFSKEGAIDSVAMVSDQLSEILTIDLYPNPTLKTVQIEFSNLEVLTNEVRLIDQNGKILYQQKEFTGNFEVNLEAYPVGTYFIWLLLDDKVHRYQVVKK